MAKIQLGIAPTSVKLRVKLMNSSVSTGAGLTGLTSASGSLLISTIQEIEGANGEASATTYTQAGSTIETISTLGTYAAPTATKCRFKEVDATNHPGIYEIQLADARFSATGDATKPMTLLISVSGAANLAQADIEVECRNQAVNVIQAGGVAWGSGAITDAVFAAATYPKALRTATAQSGAAGYIQLDASAGATNDTWVGCSIKIVGGTGIGQSRTIVLYVAATQRAYVDRVWATNPANDSVFVINVGKLTADVSNVGVATAGAPTTITLAATAVATNDYYDGAIVQILSGTGVGQSRIIIGYVGATKVATVADAWATQPDNTSVYMVRGLGDVEVGVNNDKTGYALSAAGVTAVQTGLATPTNITAGTITTVTNLTNAPTNGDLTAAMKASLSTTTYPGGFICYDSAAANTNTVIGVDGTPANPVSTPAAAKTLADALGTKAIFIKGTWTNAVTMTGYFFKGSGHTAVLNFNSTNMTGCYFEYLDLRGINTGLTNIYNKVTTLNTFTVAGVVFDSEIGNTSQINGYSNLWNCQPTNTGAITLNFGATLQAVNIDNLFTTYATLTGLANAGSTVDVMFTGYPDITIDASCTAGTINLMGFIKSITNNGTATVNDRRTAVSIAGTTDANVVSIDGQATAGNNATLNLKQLNVVNNAGDAIIASSTGSNGHGINASGNGAGEGMSIKGGATGHGLLAFGGNTSGSGIVAGAISGIGLYAQGGGDGSGIDARGAGYGRGLYVEGGATASAALDIYNPSASGDGLKALATGGDGIAALSYSGGNGISANGNGAGSGVKVNGGATGDGMKINGGATSGDAVKIGTTDGEGVVIDAQGTGKNGLHVESAAGNGIAAAGGGASGNGMLLTRGGAGGYDLKGATPSSNIPMPVSGTADANVVSIDSSVPAAVQLAKSAKTIVSATVNIVDFAPTTTEFETADLTDPAADFYKTRTVIFTSGTLTNQAREITASSFNAGTGKTHLTVRALTAAPAAGVGFNIV